MITTFTYNQEQALEIGLVGLERSVSSILHKRKDKVVASDRGIEIHLEGAWSEGAFCYIFGLPLSLGIDTFKAADIGANIQIRSTKYPGGKLLVKKQDNPEHIYVLMCGEFPTYRAAGYITGQEARQEKYWGELKSHYSGPPCFIIPQSELSKDWSKCLF